MRAPIHHLGYVVSDLRTGVERVTAALGAGPFFAMEHIEFDEVTYLGEPAVYDHSSAFGQWGPILLELTEVHEAQPTGLRQALVAPGDGVGHVAWLADSLEDEIARLHAAGLNPVSHRPHRTGVRGLVRRRRSCSGTRSRCCSAATSCSGSTPWCATPRRLGRLGAAAHHDRAAGLTPRRRLHRGRRPRRRLRSRRCERGDRRPRCRRPRGRGREDISRRRKLRVLGRLSVRRGRAARRRPPRRAVLWQDRPRGARGLCRRPARGPRWIDSLGGATAPVDIAAFGGMLPSWPHFPGAGQVSYRQYVPAPRASGPDRVSGACSNRPSAPRQIEVSTRHARSTDCRRRRRCGGDRTTGRRATPIPAAGGVVLACGELRGRPRAARHLPAAAAGVGRTPGQHRRLTRAWPRRRRIPLAHERLLRLVRLRASGSPCRVHARRPRPELHLRRRRRPPLRRRDRLGGSRQGALRSPPTCPAGPTVRTCPATSCSTRPHARPAR